MGSFHYTGWYSNLPIHPGERIVAIIGIIDKTVHKDTFGPGFRFTPISLPVRGEYDDYGGIENIDKTDATRHISNFFGIPAEEVISTIMSDEASDEWVENIKNKANDLHQPKMKKQLSSDKQINKQINSFIKSCEDKMNDPNTSDEERKTCKDAIESYKSFCETINTARDYVNDYNNKELSKDIALDVIYEHESIFDELVRIGNPVVCDYSFWQIPTVLIEKLGYTEHITGKNHGYTLAEYTHDNYPSLMRDCYIFNKSLYDENYDYRYSNTMHSISDICNNIGMNIPDEFKNTTYYEYVFNIAVDLYNNPDNDEYSDEKLGDKFEGFERDSSIDRTHNLFKLSEYHSTWYLLALYTDDELIKSENKKDVADLWGLYQAMAIMNITWGQSHYSNESIDSHRYGRLMSSIMQKAVEAVNMTIDDDEEDENEIVKNNNKRAIIDNMSAALKDFKQMCIDNVSKIY